MDVLKRAVAGIRSMWAGLSPGRRIVLGVVLASLVPILLWTAAVSTADGMVKVAGAELREDERAQIVRKLQEKNLRYDVRGGEIYLPAGEAERVMFELNAEGVFSDEAIWKYVLESNIMDTGKDKEMKFQIARQRKLERMLRNIRGVRNASVQVTPQSESDRFFSGAPRASASVQLELAAGHVLKPANVEAIAGLVARAVPGLDPDRVHIMDTTGRAYAVRRTEGLAGGASEIRPIEVELEDQIEAKLRHIFPEARVVVRVKARPSEVQTEKTRNSNPVALVEEERRVEEGAAAAAAPSAGPTKGGQVLEPSPEAAPARPRGERETKVQYVVDTERERVRTPAGAVEKITVGVLVPVREADLERERQKEAEYKDLVLKAVGPQADRDSVSLMFVPTRPPEPLPEPDLWEQAREFLSSRAVGAAAVVLMVLAAGAVLYALLRRSMPGTVVEDLRRFEARVSGEAALLPPPGVALSEEDVDRVRRSVREMAARNPRAVAGILRRWVGGR